jgi:hypothetical protein
MPDVLAGESRQGLHETVVGVSAIDALPRNCPFYGQFLTRCIAMDTSRAALKADTTYEPFPKNFSEAFWRRRLVLRERSMARTA